MRYINSRFTYLLTYHENCYEMPILGCFTIHINLLTSDIQVSEA